MSSTAYLNFIDGEFVPGSGGNKVIKRNPFNGESLGEVFSADTMDVIRAIQVAKKTFQDLEKQTLEERADLLQRMADRISAQAEEWSAQEALHQGLPQKFVLEKNIRIAAAHFQKAAQELRSRSEAHSLHAQPTGLVTLILSWNLSLRLLSERLAPALAAGNVCLVKISEESPVTVSLFGRLLQEVRAPKGWVQFFQGPGAEVGPLLAAHPSVRAVNFVGRLGVAEKVLAASIPQFKKVQIYSGAKNSALILADADFKNKMPLMMESFLLGQGQLCWNTTRLFILESVQKDFVQTLQEYLGSLRPSSSPQDPSPWTPLIRPGLLQEMQAKTGQILSEQGKILSGGRIPDGPGFFYPPTVSLDLPNCSELQQEEIRGPIFILTAVKYQHEMVKWANTGYYGHSAVIWGSDEKAAKVAEKLDVGAVSVNSWLGSEYRPGHRQSSYGNLETGAWGSFYSDVKVLTGSSF